ncbi:unnamed protein product [Ascophyllum nodosum]
MSALFAWLLLDVSADAFITSSSLSSLSFDRERHACQQQYRSPVPTVPSRLKCQAISKTCGAIPIFRRTCARSQSIPLMSAEEDITPPHTPEYRNVTVREAVEWTMSNDSGFTYIDVRSAEEHENLATPRGALCIPAFERAHRVPSPAEDGADPSLPLDDEDYNYENVEWKVLPDFVDRVKAQFKPDAKLLIGYKTKRSAEACRLLADAGFTELFNVESRTFMKTRLQQAWE